MTEQTATQTLDSFIRANRITMTAERMLGSELFSDLLYNTESL